MTHGQGHKANDVFAPRGAQQSGVSADFFALGYDAFGSLLPGRNFSSDSYRFGFNGMRKDDEVHNATGTSYDFGARIYDARLGRWPTLDPLSSKYPQFSPYAFAANSPLILIDPDGEDIVLYLMDGSQRKPLITLVTEVKGEFCLDKHSLPTSLQEVAEMATANPVTVILDDRLYRVAANFNIFGPPDAIVASICAQGQLLTGGKAGFDVVLFQTGPDAGEAHVYKVTSGVLQNAGVGAGAGGEVGFAWYEEPDSPSDRNKEGTADNYAGEALQLSAGAGVAGGTVSMPTGSIAGVGCNPFHANGGWWSVTAGAAAGPEVIPEVKAGVGVYCVDIQEVRDGIMNCKP